MCLIIFAHRAHPDYPLLVAANRDEHYTRPTRSARVWPEQPQLLAGRDEEAGGTWLGITRGGRFAAITNHRNPPSTPEQPRSRGLLTLDYLLGDQSPANYLESLATRCGEYAGFNLLLGDEHSLYYFSNIEQDLRALEPGIYGLSNALLDSDWPKQVRGRERMQQLIEDNHLDHDSLASAVSRHQPESDSALPDTGVGIDFERLLSAQFIISPDYGTRAMTTLRRDREGRCQFREEEFTSGGESTGSASFELSPDAGA